MQISRHGGHCCGIKHIFHFGYYPDYLLPASDAKMDKNFYSDHSFPGVAVESIGPVPKETYAQRFLRLIVWLEERRPQGIIEAVFADNTYNKQTKLWAPFLRKYGFTRVTPKEGVRNSNSGNRLHVFHRYSGVKKPLDASKLPKVGEQLS